ncbi:MAG: peptidoglycan DL-endopeptidase RipB [Thermoleophilaceae bacterium]|nr:peptidoglycan DL-endopeptidase RipB [Thermoleophilaceae bacterium]
MENSPPELSRILLIAACVAVFAGCGNAVSEKQQGPAEVVLTPEAAAQARAAADRKSVEREQRSAVIPGSSATDDAPSPGAPSDAEVRTELREARAALASFREYLDTTAFLATGPRASVRPDGAAIAPDDAPEVVKRVILAANAIAKFPYKWGGGHGAWRDDGYDCSGSVSFALASAGLLNRPLTSGLFMRYGEQGPGEWITIYANDGHVFMLVAGLRFDTSGQGRAGTRWQQAPRPVGGFAIRHIAGL